MVANVLKVECFLTTKGYYVEQHENGHHLASDICSGGCSTACRTYQMCVFQFGCEIFAEFVQHTENRSWEWMFYVIFYSHSTYIRC